MLDDEERTAIDEQRAHYPDAQAALVDALKIVQRHRRWVSDEAVKDIADHFGMPAAAVDNVATFYNLIFRRPVGKHVVLLCDSVSCWVMGYDELRRKLEDHLGVGFGGTTKDGRFTLLPMCCLGACDHAPVLMIDDDLHHDVEPEAVEALLARYAGDGTEEA
jgi:NADH-quinone oxidoreductase subunit E